MYLNFISKCTSIDMFRAHTITIGSMYLHMELTCGVLNPQDLYKDLKILDLFSKKLTEDVNTVTFDEGEFTRLNTDSDQIPSYIKSDRNDVGCDDDAFLTKYPDLELDQRPRNGFTLGPYLFYITSSSFEGDSKDLRTDNNIVIDVERYDKSGSESKWVLDEEESGYEIITKFCY